MNKSIKVQPLLDRLSAELCRCLSASQRLDSAVVVGIRSGGVWIAEALHTALQLKAPLGTLNINFYRDDFSRIGLHPQVGPSQLPTSIDDRHVILVDDVLHTGRTIRAALNEIFDYGRPMSVTLAVLVDRGGRELPIQADVCGDVVALEEKHNIKLQGPNPLELKIIERNPAT